MCEQLSAELQEYDYQFAALGREAEALLDGLSTRQLEWRRNVGSWSIGDCLNHLAVTGDHSLSNIRSAMAAARTRGWLGAGPFRHPIAGNLLIILMDAPPRIRFKVPKAYRPMEDASMDDILAAFWRVQTELTRALREANGIDLARVKVANPVTGWFKLTLGQEFALTAAHERRHLWQARRVRQELLST